MSLQICWNKGSFTSLLSAFSWALLQHGESLEMKYIHSPCPAGLVKPHSLPWTSKGWLVGRLVSRSTENTVGRGLLAPPWLDRQGCWNWAPKASRAVRSGLFPDSALWRRRGEGKVQGTGCSCPPAWRQGWQTWGVESVSGKVIHLIQKAVLLLMVSRAGGCEELT